MFVKCK